jgi:squalene synthase HpnC
MAVDHYENFPVASILLPPALREPVAAIYWFARNADDFADEGNLPPEERRALLAEYQAELDAIEHDRPSRHPVFLRLRPVIAHYELPLQVVPRPARRLHAGRGEGSLPRLRRTDGLLPPFRRPGRPPAAAPVRRANAQNLARSDAICSALQLINHWQDVGIDAAKGDRGRIYLPQDDMARFGVGDDDIRSRVASADFRSLLRFQVQRARTLMLSGAPLGWDLPGRIGLEIRAIVAGGLRVLDKIEAVDYDVFKRRPKLDAFDWPLILWRSLVRPADPNR